MSRAGLAASDEEQSDSGAETSEGDQDSVDEEMNGTANDKSSRNTTDEEEDEGDDETDETSISDAGENNQLPEDDESADDAPAVDRSQLRQLMTDQRETVAASIAEAGKADAEKGQAVKQQRKTFDTLLNSRIRLQQGLAAVNTLSLDDFATEAFTPDVVAAAEEAALRLWRTLDTLRTSISAARTGEKRRRPALPASAPSASLWQHMQEREQADTAHRRAVLSKWSAKTQAVTTAAPAARRLAATSAPAAGLVDVLDAQLATDAPRLLKRTRTPRSCAPAQAAAGLAEADVYDDADFYGLLLKELLERRGGETAGAHVVDVGDASRQWRAAREAKTRRAVDTKASKGRKMRYTVHEKLQNFMAPEDRGSWGERQTEDLFGSLLGRGVGLGEEVAEAVGAREGTDAEEEALTLFRS